MSLRYKIFIYGFLVLLLGLLINWAVSHYMNPESPTSPNEAPIRSTEAETFFLSLLKEHFPGTSTLPRKESCDVHPILNKLIDQRNYRPLVSCRLERFFVQNEEFWLVNISYGSGVDCPSGCIFNDAIIFAEYTEGGLIERTLHYPEPDMKWDGWRYLFPKTTYGDYCGQPDVSYDIESVLYHNMNNVMRFLVKNGDQYYWAFTFRDFEGSGKGNGCTINGYLMTTLDDLRPSHSSLNIKFHPSTCARQAQYDSEYGSRTLEWCCENLGKIKKLDPSLKNYSAPACENSNIENLLQYSDEAPKVR